MWCMRTHPVVTLGSWQLLAAAASFKAAGGMPPRLLGRWRELRLAIWGVATLRRRLFPIRSWGAELAVLFPWLLSGLCVLWIEVVVEFVLLEADKLAGTEVMVTGDGLVSIEADVVECCKPL